MKVEIVQRLSNDQVAAEARRLTATGTLDAVSNSVVGMLFEQWLSAGTVEAREAIYNQYLGLSMVVGIIENLGQAEGTQL